MQKNLIKVEDDFQEENEINIYDIINIFIKNMKIFFIVTFIGIIITGLYVTKRIIYDKYNILTIDYTLNYEELESYLGGRLYYPKKNPIEILLEDEYLEKLFENKELKELYKKKVKENGEDISKKREFLLGLGEQKDKAMFNIIQKGETQPNSYRVRIKLNKKDDLNRKVSTEILKAYLKVLKEYYDINIFEYIKDRKIYVTKRLPILKAQLEESAVNKNNLPTDRNNLTENNFLRYIYPVKVSNIDTYYTEYIKLESENQAISFLDDLGLNNANKFIQYDTSILIEREKSGNLGKLIAGLGLSIFLGIIVIYIKEFIERYKENKKKI